MPNNEVNNMPNILLDASNAFCCVSNAMLNCCRRHPKAMLCMCCCSYACYSAGGSLIAVGNSVALKDLGTALASIGGSCTSLACCCGNNRVDCSGLASCCECTGQGAKAFCDLLETIPCLKPIGRDVPDIDLRVNMEQLGHYLTSIQNACNENPAFEPIRGMIGVVFDNMRRTSIQDSQDIYNIHRSFEDGIRGILHNREDVGAFCFPSLPTRESVTASIQSCGTNLFSIPLLCYEVPSIEGNPDAASHTRCGDLIPEIGHRVYSDMRIAHCLQTFTECMNSLCSRISSRRNGGVAPISDEMERGDVVRTDSVKIDEIAIEDNGTSSRKSDRELAESDVKEIFGKVVAPEQEILDLRVTTNLVSKPSLANKAAVGKNAVSPYLPQQIER